jgi:transcriptional regulator with XRE-family HTH domain
MRPVAELAASKPHGTRIKYMGGCRCLPCRAANAQYAAQRSRAVQAGLSGKLVPSAEARNHLKELTRLGVGLRSVSAATDVSRSILREIRKGRRTQIRASTEAKILNVDRSAFAGGAIVSAVPTRKQITELLSEGFTSRELARRTGVSANVLQMKRPHIRAFTAARIDRFYRIIMKGA